MVDSMVAPTDYTLVAAKARTTVVCSGSCSVVRWAAKTADLSDLSTADTMDHPLAVTLDQTMVESLVYYLAVYWETSWVAMLVALLVDNLDFQTVGSLVYTQVVSLAS